MSREIMEFISIIVILIAIVFGSVIGLGSMYDKKSCTNYQDITGRNTQYKFFGGCFVNTDSGWLTQNEYSQVIIAREGLKQSN